MQKTLRIKNKVSELTVMNQFLEETGEELGLSATFIMSLNLVLEEAVSNVIFYAYKKESENGVIDISFAEEDGVCIFTLIDEGIPFDPTLKKDPDITLSVEDRPIGGLGIFLIKKIMDEVEYKREENRNILILKKKITE